MSDYGSLLKVKKKLGKFSYFEKFNLKQKIKKLIKTESYKDALGISFKCNLSNAEEGSHFTILLSEFWYGQGDDRVNFNFGKKGDAFDAKKLTEQLNHLFSKKYEIIWTFKNWHR